MTRSQAALLSGAAALAGVTATSVAGGGGDARAPAPAQTLWASPGPAAPARVGASGWWSRKGAAVVRRDGVGLAAAVATPGHAIADARYPLRVPLGDPLMLGTAPVSVTLDYALVDRDGWADARIDVQPEDARRRFEVVGARDGAGSMTIMLPAATVRMRGGVAIDVALRVRTLGGGRATLLLRSVTLAGGGS